MSDPDPVAEYSTLYVVELSGATFRQLDHWVRRGVLQPSIRNGGRGPDHWRLWSW